MVMNCEGRDRGIVLKISGDCVYENKGVIHIALITYGITDFCWMQINDENRWLWSLEETLTKVTQLPVCFIVIFPFYNLICKYSILRSDSYSNFYCLTIDEDKIILLLSMLTFGDTGQAKDIALHARAS